MPHITVEYEITTEPVRDAYIEALPEKEKAALLEQIERLYHLTFDNPRKSIVEITALLEKHPDYPWLYNYLTTAYERIGDDENVRQSIYLSYVKNPDYLFAKLGYAELLLQEQRYDEVPAVFDGKFDLKLLYPHREVFHISEAIGFMGAIGYYKAKIKDDATAHHYLRVLQQLAPEHHRTERLAKVLLLKNVENIFRKKPISKIGRNDLCPCGSGKKYKKCCSTERTFTA